MKKQILALTLTLCVLLSAGTASAETIKHERLYAVTGADGTVWTLLDNVRLESDDLTGVLTDATRLQKLENVGGQERFTQEGETLVWQLEGKPITYQGTAEEPLPVTPVARLMLDGETVTADQLLTREGELTLEVAYTTCTDAPFVAVTVLPLSEETLCDVTIDHGTVLRLGDQTLVVGWGVPGLDEDAGLPSGFTVQAYADHADLRWMTTAATAQPLATLSGCVGENVTDARALYDRLTTCLYALQKDEAVEGDDEVASVLTQLIAMMDGVKALQEGSGALQDGVSSAEEGAATLESGLTTLTANSEQLNQGAQQLMEAILAAANEQLSAAGLEQAGIVLPTLTTDNYAQVLEAAIAQLAPDTLRASALESASNQVREAVLQQEETIRAAVQQVLEAKALESVLTASGMPMTAEAYGEAVKAGQITQEQAEQIAAAMGELMGSEEAATQLEMAFAQQVEVLVEEQLSSEAVQSQLEAALAPGYAAWQALSALKEQLDGVSAFVSGLSAYTDGVSQAAEGAARLHSGLETLCGGASQLYQGAVTLDTALVTARDEATAQALALLEGNVQQVLVMLEKTMAQADGSVSYDLIPDGMAHDLLVIIRTDFKE